MKVLTLILLLLSPISSFSDELTIKYDTKPTIYINSHDNMTLTIEPNGQAKWFGNIKLPVLNGNKGDWEDFFKDANSKIYKTKYTKEQYQEILNLTLNLISNAKPSNKDVVGPGYVSFTVNLWGSPEVEITYGSIGGEDFPAEVEKLNVYMKQLPKPDKLKPQEK